MALNHAADPNWTGVKESESKFTLDGRPRYFPGITIVCHFGQGDPIFDEAVKLCYDDNDKQLEGYVQLPKASLHMTLFDIMTYQADLGSSSINDMRTLALDKYLERFESLDPKIQEILPIKLKIDTGSERHPRQGHPLNIPLVPSDSQEEQKLTSIREAISSEFDRPLKPGYGFHITLYYALWLQSEEDFSRLADSWSSSMKRISETVDSITINRFELCTFENMFHFEPVATVGVR